MLFIPTTAHICPDGNVKELKLVAHLLDNIHTELYVIYSHTSSSDDDLKCQSSFITKREKMDIVYLLALSHSITHQPVWILNIYFCIWDVFSTYL